MEKWQKWLCRLAWQDQVNPTRLTDQMDQLLQTIILLPLFPCRSLQRAHEHVPVRGLQEVLRPQAIPRDAPQGLPQRASGTPRRRRPELLTPSITTTAAGSPISGKNQTVIVACPFQGDSVNTCNFLLTFVEAGSSFLNKFLHYKSQVFY